MVKLATTKQDTAGIEETGAGLEMKGDMAVRSLLRYVTPRHEMTERTSER